MVVTLNYFGNNDKIKVCTFSEDKIKNSFDL